jgi:hypothetical protein
MGHHGLQPQAFQVQPMLQGFHHFNLGSALLGCMLIGRMGMGYMIEE